MNRHNDLHTSMFEQSIHTGVVIACFDAFCQTMTKKTVVVVDNASIHRSEEFADRIPHWKKHGLIIQYLPPYSPELNGIFHSPVDSVIELPARRSGRINV